MSGDREDADLELVQQALDLLGEHFDSVHVFCTRHEAGEEDGTISVSKGTGNWFARLGQIREWMLKQDEGSRCTARHDSADDD